VPGIALGTAVVPTYPRHPAALAQQARTVALATSGRLTLGIGLSHKVVIEDMFGYNFDRPLRHMDEYLSALLPLLAGEPAGFTGETLRAHVSLDLDAAAGVVVGDVAGDEVVVRRVDAGLGGGACRGEQHRPPPYSSLSEKVLPDQRMPCASWV
jgi:hypothetical protein